MKKRTKLLLSKASAMLLACLLLCGMVLPAFASTTIATYTYAARYTGSSNSLVDALKAVGENSAYSHRKTLASLNGISGYTGKSWQNQELLQKLKGGVLITSVSYVEIPDETDDGGVVYFARYNGSSNSLVDGLKAIGEKSDYSYRKSIAALNGISDYSGKSSQNTELLQKLKGGVLIKEITSGGDDPVDNTGASLVDPNANLSVSNRGKENGIKYASYEGQRSAAAYNTVIDQYYVQSNTRYSRTSSGLTWCNILCWDVTRAMNAEVPHWVKNNAPATSNTKGAWEMNANATYNWLRDYGAKYGWTKVSAAEAQARANAGYPTIAIWKNTSGGSGHVAVVRPEGAGYSYSSSKGPVIAQAGARNFAYGNVSDGFGSSRMSSVVYYTHN